MYYWKIWRDTRVRFFALLILGLCVGLLSVWTQYDFALAAAMRKKGLALSPAATQGLWKAGMFALTTASAVVIYFLGLVIGCSGLGEEMEQGSAAFLLTRPRSRGYFVWAYWFAAAAELLAFTSVLMIAGYASLFHLIGDTGPWSLLLITPMLMITGLLAVGVAQLITTLSRRSKNAAAGGFAFTLTYMALLGIWKYLRLERHLNYVPNLPSPLRMYGLDWSAALGGNMLGWFAVAVGFVALSHVIVRRMEI